MKYILAVSGGVDSVVLLDQFALRHQDFVVAHFDHGVRSREESSNDADFVRNLCKKYDIKCIVAKGELGPNAGEELARTKRYEFLRKVCESENADAIVTAHHQDDLIETVIMNLIRGTGWRGLAPMASDVVRPLLDLSKVEIVAYAIDHELDWVEDKTNWGLRYFRNRVRVMMHSLSAEQRKELVKLVKFQTILRPKIEAEIGKIKLHDSIIPRYFLIMIPDNVAIEILRTATGGRLTRPQLELILLFAKTAMPHKQMEFKQIKIRATKREIFVEK